MGSRFAESLHERVHSLRGLDANDNAIFVVQRHERSGGRFFPECMSFRLVVLERRAILDCRVRMRSPRIVAESRVTLRCVYFPSAVIYAVYTCMHFYKESRDAHPPVARPFRGPIGGAARSS